MINYELREELSCINPDFVLFDNHAYDKSIVGYSDDNRIIYDYDKMVEELMEDEGWTAEEATEWIDYNTVRALPYTQNSPIILYPIDYLR